MEFTSKTVVVTGGTRGIGRAVSLQFAREGATVFAAYRERGDEAEKVTRDAATLPGIVIAVKADVGTADGAVALMDTAARETKGIDILINNAGVIRDGYLAMMAEDDWETVLRNNLSSLFHCCKWGVRKMIGRTGGAIVNISSVSALTGAAGQTNYAAAKGGIISFSKSLAREVGSLGIRVNAVAAGLIDTDMTAGLKPEQVKKILSSSVLNRLGTPDEVAEAVLFLASSRASYITGHCLVVDGGIV